MAEPSRRGSSHGEVDVAVVGGGPGGLATAAALKAAFGDEMRIKVRHYPSALFWASSNPGQVKACWQAASINNFSSSSKRLLAGV